MRPYLLPGLLALVYLGGCRATRVNTEIEAVGRVRRWALANSSASHMLFDSATAGQNGRWWLVGVPKANCHGCIPDNYSFRIKKRNGKVVHMPLK